MEAVNYSETSVTITSYCLVNQSTWIVISIDLRSSKL